MNSSNRDSERCSINFTRVLRSPVVSFSDFPTGIAADITEIQPLNSPKKSPSAGILQNISRATTPSPMPVNSCDEYILQPQPAGATGQQQQKYYRSPCDRCGYHNFPIMSHSSQLPISPLARSQNSLEMVDTTSPPSPPNNLLVVHHHSNMRRNDSSYSVGLPTHELAVSRRPSILLQEILTTRRPSLVLGGLRGRDNYKNPKTMRLLQEHRSDGSVLSINGGPNGSVCDSERGPKSALAKHSKFKNRRVGDDAISSTLSALYCKILVLMGVCLPITEIISDQIPSYIYQGFYVYLYSLSVLFVFFLYICAFRHRALFNVLKDFHEKNNNVHLKRKAARFGSFYLRIGAIAFAIGNMVYSGLEFGQFFELNGQPGCQDPFLAITPIARIALCIIQVQFIFLNTTFLDMACHKVICRFGLMHMVATNLCEWLYVLVEETKHEIFHVAHHQNAATPTLDWKPLNATHGSHNLTVDITNISSTMNHRGPGCSRTNIMGALVQEVSPFLFPCTIEYSLICAVILYEMWKTVKSLPDIAKTRKDSMKQINERQSSHTFSVDCSQSHKGLFVGILVIVMTIISIIMYFVLYMQPGYELIATQEVTLWETIIYAFSAVAIVTGMFLMRDLKYVASDDHHSMKLDCTLLIVAQTGVYLYGMFSIMGSYFSKWDTVPDRVEGIVAEVFNLLQTSLQTMFIMHSVHRRCKGSKQQRKKPGREIITYLLVANMAIWFINTLIKGRAVFRETHLEFFGVWGWTIITHVSMPLAIFYRFHSTICLFEVWKITYKAKTH